MKRSIIFIFLMVLSFSAAAQEQKWQLEAVVSPHYSYHIDYGFNMGMPRDETVKPAFYTGAGARIRYHFTKGFSLATGLGLNRYGYTTEQYAVVDARGKVLDMTRAEYKYDVVEMPLNARVILAGEFSWKPFFSFGPVLQYFYHQRTSVYGKYENNHDLWFSEASPSGFSPFKLGFNMGLGISPRLTDKLSLLIEPYIYNYYFASKNLSNTQLYGYGLNTGVAFKL